MKWPGSHPHAAPDQPQIKPESGPKRGKSGRRLEKEVDRVREELAGLVKHDGSVFAGPFTGEVGFELLYWIPMLRWAVREFPELRDRLVVISRGGTQDWLNGLDVQYVDILTLFPPEDFARHRALSDKQRQMAEFESRVIEAVQREFGFAKPAVLHPSVLYDSYFRFLKVNRLAYPVSVKRTENGVEGLTSIYTPIDLPDSEGLSDLLSDDYVAVRFYSSEAFPNEPETRRFASAVIESLSRRTNVVLLGNPHELDEHRDVQGELVGDVTRIDHLLAPENNLTIQTAVVGRAKAFVGTYGGFSYLAPFLGVPSLSFSVDWERSHSWHYELAQKVFNGPEWGAFVRLRHTELPLVDLVTREFAFDEVPGVGVTV